MKWGLCNAESYGSVSAIAREKVRWVLNNVPGSQDRMVVGLDTVPLVCKSLPMVDGRYLDALNAQGDEMFAPLGDLDVAEARLQRLMQALAGVSDAGLLAHVSHNVYHKPRTVDKAAEQIEDLFRALTQGEVSNRFISHVLTREVKTTGKRKVVFNQTGEDWWEKQRGRRRWILDYMLNRQYLSRCTRIVTGIAVHQPGTDTIETCSANADISFTTLGNWVDWRYSPEKLKDDLVPDVLKYQQQAGANPHMIPGGIDYGLFGHTPNLDCLLHPTIHDHGKVTDRWGTFKGLPKEGFERFLEDLARKETMRRLRRWA